MTTTTKNLTVDGIGAVEVTLTDRGQGRTFLLLHGGAGPQSVTGFADLLATADAEHARVIAPVHPGFDGTPRPEALATVPGLAALYVALLDELDLTDVTVVGNSIGGWIAAEMALLGSARVGGVVLVDAVGIEVAGHPVVDFFSLTLDDVARLSYHDPERFRIDPAAMTAAQREVMAGNRAALAVYGGAMTDPGLRGRLAGIDLPVLVLWGESDRIVDPDFGRAYAAAIPGARFHLLTGTGHVPQIETPRQLLDAIREFAAGTSRVSIVGPDDGEVALSGPVRMRILEDGGTTRHRLGMGEITIAPHTEGPPQHRHAQHDEGFYVVSGTARFTVGHESYDVGAGTLVMVPPGAPHTFANPGDEPAVLLNTFTPDLYVRYFRDLRDIIASGRPMTDEAVVEVMGRYATEPATEFAP
jgi:pimeloyl-ACP methyl ester carboxylesterase/mannose-6-phosphate isomerase-like protein (cupin superfamily)